MTAFAYLGVVGSGQDKTSLWVSVADCRNYQRPAVFFAFLMVVLACLTTTLFSGFGSWEGVSDSEGCVRAGDLWRCRVKYSAVVLLCVSLPILSPLRMNPLFLTSYISHLRFVLYLPSLPPQQLYTDYQSFSNGWSTNSLLQNMDRHISRDKTRLTPT